MSLVQTRDQRVMFVVNVNAWSGEQLAKDEIERRRDIMGFFVERGDVEVLQTKHP